MKTDLGSTHRIVGLLRRRWMAVVGVVVLTQMMVINAVRPLISYRAIELGADTGDLGLVAAAYAGLSLFLAVPVGRRVDRLGEGPFILVGGAVVAVASVLVPLAPSVLALALVQSVLGVGQLVSIMGIQALVANAGDPTGRDVRFGAFAAVASVGQMVGPPLGGWLAGASGVGGTTAFVTIGLVAVASVVAGVALWRWPPRREERGSGAASLLGSQPLLPMLRLPGMRTAMWASLTALASIDILVAYLPAYGERYGISVVTIGLLLGARAAGSTVIRIGMGPMLRVAGARRLLTASFVVTAAALALLPVVPSGPLWLLFVLLVVAGMGLGLGQPITMSWVATRAPIDQRGTALGLRITGNRFGQLFLPAAVGLVAGPAGVSGVILALGAVLASSAVLVVRSQLTLSTPADRPDRAPPQ